MAVIGNIAKGFLGKKPVGEAWYDQRMEICSGCPLNTKNMESKDVSLIHTTQSKTFCHGGGVCTACGCCIAEKASVKAEECGRVKLGQEPLWNKIEDNVNLDPFVKLRVLAPSDASLVLINKQPYVKKIFNSEQDLKVTIKLLLTDKRGLNVTKVVGGCTCTASSVKRLSNVQTEVTLEISTTAFSLDTNERQVTIYRANGKNTVVTLQFTKQKNEL